MNKFKTCCCNYAELQNKSKNAFIYILRHSLIGSHEVAGAFIKKLFFCLNETEKYVFTIFQQPGGDQLGDVANLLDRDDGETDLYGPTSPRCGQHGGEDHQSDRWLPATSAQDGGICLS